LPKPPPKVRDRHGRGAAKVFVPTWCDAGPQHRGDGSSWSSVGPDGALLSDFVANTPQVVGQIQQRKTSHEDPDDYW
jgi:hypothetical protein